MSPERSDIQAIIDKASSGSIQNCLENITQDEFDAVSILVRDVFPQDAFSGDYFSYWECIDPGDEDVIRVACQHFQRENVSHEQLAELILNHNPVLVAARTLGEISKQDYDLRKAELAGKILDNYTHKYQLEIKYGIRKKTSLPKSTKFHSRNPALATK